jgi:hypothetical protein
MKFKGGGPTGMQMTCLRCKGTGVQGHYVCGHKDPQTRHWCGHIATVGEIQRFEASGATVMHCGHKQGELIPPAKCRLCNGTGYIPIQTAR